MAAVMPYSDASDCDQWYEDEESNTPDSILLSLVQSYDWAGTLARIASHPDGKCGIIGCHHISTKWYLTIRVLPWVL